MNICKLLPLTIVLLFACALTLSASEGPDSRTPFRQRSDSGPAGIPVRDQQAFAIAKRGLVQDRNGSINWNNVSDVSKIESIGRNDKTGLVTRVAFKDGSFMNFEYTYDPVSPSQVSGITISNGNSTLHLSSTDFISPPEDRRDLISLINHLLMPPGQLLFNPGKIPGLNNGFANPTGPNKIDFGIKPYVPTTPIDFSPSTPTKVGVTPFRPVSPGDASALMDTASFGQLVSSLKSDSQGTAGAAFALLNRAMTVFENRQNEEYVRYLRRTDAYYQAMQTFLEEQLNEGEPLLPEAGNQSRQEFDQALTIALRNSDRRHSIPPALRKDILLMREELFNKHIGPALENFKTRGSSNSRLLEKEIKRAVALLKKTTVREDGGSVEILVYVQ